LKNVYLIAYLYKAFTLVDTFKNLLNIVQMLVYQSYMIIIYKEIIVFLKKYNIIFHVLKNLLFYYILLRTFYLSKKLYQYLILTEKLYFFFAVYKRNRHRI